MTQEKSYGKYFIAAVIIAALLLMLPVIITLLSPVRVLVLDADDNYYLARKPLICGSSVIYLKSSFSDSRRRKALNDKTGSFTLAMDSLKNIKLIEIIPDDETADDESGEVPAGYLGKYRINVQGHDGTLYLGSKEGKIYGSVKFRTWGTGATEYLKGIRISGKKIYFTRSASTSAEARRVGANHVFWQKFSGTYSQSGKKITGFFVNDRKEKYEWKAEK